MVSCKELRNRARETLDHKVFGKTWLFSVLAVLIFGASLGVATAVGTILPVIGNIAAFLAASGPLMVGLATFFLNMFYRTKKKSNLLELFMTFTKPKNYLLGVFMFLFIGLWSLLFIIPGIIKAFSYSLAPFIKAQNPNMTSLEAIGESKRLMEGNKAKLFKLMLSFIGWIALCILPVVGWCLIPWVGSYILSALTEFYEEIKANDTYI